MKLKLKHCLIAAIAIVSTLIYSGITHIPLNASIAVPQTHSQLVAQSEISQGNSEDKIIFGYIADAPPVSSQTGAFISGYCGELKAYLEGQGLKLDPVTIQYPQRFKAFEKVRDSVIQRKQPAIECGPGTKTIQREELLKNSLKRKVLQVSSQIPSLQQVPNFLLISQSFVT